MSPRYHDDLCQEHCHQRDPREHEVGGQHPVSLPAVLARSQNAITVLYYITETEATTAELNGFNTLILLLNLSNNICTIVIENNRPNNPIKVILRTNRSDYL